MSIIGRTRALGEGPLRRSVAMDLVLVATNVVGAFVVSEQDLGPVLLSWCAAAAAFGLSVLAVSRAAPFPTLVIGLLAGAGVTSMLAVALSAALLFAGIWSLVGVLSGACLSNTVLAMVSLGRA